MEIYDLNYPSETSVNYFYDYFLDDFDTRDHVRLISGELKGGIWDKLNEFRNGKVFFEDFIDYNKFAKREGYFSNFFVEKMFSLGYIDSDKRKYSDSPYVYLLGCENRLGAILGIEPRPNAVFVTQIQGFVGERDVWGNLRYPDLLLDLCYRDFKDSGVFEMWVASYSRNHWKDVRDNFQNTKKRQYDIPAKRQGFVFDGNRGIWVKKL